MKELQPGEPAILDPAMKFVPPTLDQKAEAAMSELRRVARQIQELGKEVCAHDYSDGVNLGQGILDWVGACGKLANKFDEVGLCQDKESFFL